MDGFEQKIAECVTKKLTDGTVEKLIEDKLEKAVSDAIAELFSYGGDGKKLLVSKFKEVMIPAIEEHEFNQYLTKLDMILTDIVNSTTVKDNKVILDNFQFCMSETQMKRFATIPVSEIFNQYKKYVSENIDTSNLEVDTDDEPSYYNANVNLEVEENDRNWFGSYKDYLVKFTCDEDEDMNVDFRISINKTNNKGRIVKDSIPMDVFSLRNMSQFEIYIQSIIRSYSEVVLDVMDDTDDVEIEDKPEAYFS